MSETPGPTPVEASGNTPFTSADAAEVRRRLAEGETATSSDKSVEQPGQSEQPTEVMVPVVPDAQSASDAPTEVLSVPSPPTAPVIPDSSLPPEPPPSSKTSMPPDASSDVPKPSERDADPLKVVSARLTERDISLAALEVAQDRLEREQAEAKGVRGFMRNLWRATVNREYLKNRYAEEARQQIIETQNLFANGGVDKARSDSEMQATIERILQAVQHREDVFLREGESVEKAAATESQKAYQEAVKGLVTRYVNGDLPADSLAEERTRVIDTLSVQYPELKTADTIAGDNILHVAEQAKAMVEHGAELQQLLAQVQFYAAEARAGVSTEVQMNACDRLIERVQSGRFGRWFNDATIASAISVGYSAANLLSGRAVGVAGATLAPGVGTGILAGLRENFRYKGERQQHLRQRAQGLEIGDDSPRRERMDQTVYERMSASEAATAVRRLVETGGEPYNPAEMNRLLNTIAEIQLRQQLSDTEKMDLIGFSSPETVEQERLALTLAIAEGRAALRGWLETASPQQQSELGLSSGAELKDVLAARQEAYRIAIDQDITDKDRIFAKNRHRAVAGAAAKGVLTGLTVGIISQEVVSLANQHQQGALEGVLGHHDRAVSGDAVHQTFLRNLFSGHHSSVSAEAVRPPAATHFERLHSGHLMKLPDGMKLVHNPDHTINIVNNGHTVAENLSIGKNGPDAHALDQLRGAGVAHETHTITTTHTEHRVEDRGLHRYMERHPESTQRVHRVGWMDNDTPGVFDKNELKLWWGGNGNNGLDSQGNYVFNVSHMTPDGSYHAGLTENAQVLAHGGRLNIYLSASQGTQHRPFEFHIGRDGNVHIPRDSVAGLSLFERNGDHASFNGRFAEVGHVEGHTGQVQNIRVFSTYEGQGVDHLKVSVPHEVSEHHIITTLHRPPVEAPISNPVDAPPVIPVYPRREMESMARPGAVEIGAPRYLQYAGRDLESMRAWIEEEPSRLQSYRQIELADGRKVWVDGEGREVVRDTERERAVIEEYMAKLETDDPEYYSLIKSLLDSESMPPMHEGTRVAVNIPAWMEERNIFHLLTEYTKQTDKSGKPLDPDMYEINICVNRKTGVEPDGTVAEIERFIAEQAALGRHFNINFVDVEFDPPLNNVGHARRVLNDLVLLRSVQRDKQAGPLYLESEDADLEQISRRTIINAVTKLDANPQLDAIKGIDDRDPSILMQNDLLFVQKRLWDFALRIRGKARYRPENNPTWNYTWNRIYTNGWNTAITAEGLALIGGYNDHAVVGEDMEIGEKLTMIRGDGQMPNLEVVGSVPTRSSSKARRFIHSLITGDNPYGASFTDADVNESIRAKSDDELLETVSSFARINDENQAQFGALFDVPYQEALSMLGGNRARAQEFLDELMFWTGFKKGDYHVSAEGKVVIDDWTNLKAKLAEYRANPPRSAQKATTP